MPPYNQTSMTPWTWPVVTSKTISQGRYGYIKLTSEHGDDSAAVRKIYTDFRDAIAGFISQGLRGMSLNMRVNAGGMMPSRPLFQVFFIKIRYCTNTRHGIIRLTIRLKSGHNLFHISTLLHCRVLPTQITPLVLFLLNPS